VRPIFFEGAKNHSLKHKLVSLITHRSYNPPRREYFFNLLVKIFFLVGLDLFLIPFFFLLI